MSDDRPFYAPGHKGNSAPAPRPGELVWSLRKNHRQIDCELRDHGQYGVEVQLYREREFYAGRMYPNRERALLGAEEERQAIKKDEEATR